MALLCEKRKHTLYNYCENFLYKFGDKKLVFYLPIRNFSFAEQNIAELFSCYFSSVAYSCYYPQFFIHLAK